MSGDGQGRLFLKAFLVAVTGYVLLYGGIQWRRSRLGPWRVEFTQNDNGRAMLRIDQPRLGITNQQVVFNVAATPVNTAAMTFEDPRPLPFEVPYGQCIFMDTTFLPGSVTLRLFGHTVEMLPRTLIIDKQEYPWRAKAAVNVGQ